MALRQASTCLVLMIACGDAPPPSREILNVTSPDEGQIGKVGEELRIRFRVGGGEAPYFWSRNGSVPGLRLDDMGGNEATLTGIPESAGTFFVTINAEDSLGAIGNISFAIEIRPTFAPPRFETDVLPPAVMGEYYSAAFELSGGEEPIYLSVGELPGGLVYDDPSRAIIGRATEIGTFSVHVRAEDAVMRVAEVDLDLQVVGDLTIDTSSLAPARVNMPYRAELVASGGLAPYTWVAVLPPGLSLVNAALQGTPTSIGLLQMSVEVTDESGQVATQFLELEVLP